ncbi:hypothetical protein Arno18_133 [Pectobacterium phage Arno18]|uniref:Uncharacterized protein n=1 Tax=Pectobacterium phage Arno18 TaxID=2500578 RepID=A0A678ZNM5_9CAUD|nr:hypothetical protein Arno18_133 [Pectobacterium phage Arno18]
MLNNVKILIAFILIDLFVSLIALAALGAGFVAMNGLTFKLIVTVISVLGTAGVFTLYDRRQKR